MEIWLHFDSVLAMKDLLYSQSIANILKQNLNQQGDVSKGQCHGLCICNVLIKMGSTSGNSCGVWTRGIWLQWTAHAVTTQGESCHISKLFWANQGAVCHPWKQYFHAASKCQVWPVEVFSASWPPYHDFRPHPHYSRGTWKQGNLKRKLCVLVWTENIFKMELFENDDVEIIMWFVCPSLPQTQIQNGSWNGDCHVDFTTWAQLKPCYVHAHGCTQAFLPPVIVVISNFSGIVWTENILSIF